MTREEMALAIDGIGMLVKRHNIAGTKGDGVMFAVAAELRKTCSQCQHFQESKLNGRPVGMCSAHNTWPNSDGWMLVSADGSGFCHRWEAKT